MQMHRRRACSHVHTHAHHINVHARPLPRQVKLAALSGPEAVLNAALDKVLTQITKIVQDHEAKQRKLSAEKGAGAAEAVAASTPGKDITFKAGCSKEKAVKRPHNRQAGRGLPQYLALPLDQYSLLDPTWVTRPDPDGQPDLFILKVPLHGVMHVSLEPSVSIRVIVDAEHSQVHFHASSFKVGDPRFDENFTLDLNATLSCKPAPRNLVGRLLQAPRWNNSHTQQLQQQEEEQEQRRQEVWVQEQRGHEHLQHQAITGTPATAGQISNGVLNSTHMEGEQQGKAEHVNGSQSAVVVSVQQLDQGNGQYSHVIDHAQHGSNTHMSHSNNGHGYNSNGHSTETNYSQGSNSTTIAVNGTTVAVSAGTDPALGIQPVPVDEEGSKPSNALTGVLKAKVDMAFHLRVPPPLSVVPGPMLALAGSLVARAALNSMLPAFLDLLAVDYGRWATGTRSKDQAAGSLITSSQQHGGQPVVTAAAANILIEQPMPQGGQLQGSSAAYTVQTQHASVSVLDTDASSGSNQTAGPSVTANAPMAVISAGATRAK